jgi:diaminopimelate epimerase
MLIPFTKMHGLGNDFIVLDAVSNHFTLSSQQIKRLGNRHFGVGFDQLLMIEPPSQGDVDFDYRIFNADGNEVEHCGNGARCFAKFVQQKRLSEKNPIRVKTMNGVLELKINAEGNVTVDMGAPSFTPEQVPFVSQEQAVKYSRVLDDNGASLEVEFAALSVGNPHAVILADDIDSAPVEKVGKLLGAHADFPNGVNVGFMEIVDRRTVKVRVFERGVGETLACGTGACAAVVSGCVAGLLDDTVLVKLQGGELTVSWNQGQSSVLMTGPASSVFEGSIEV